MSGKFIVLSESLTQSVLKDVTSALCGLGCISAGHFLNSYAMEWAGFIFWIGAMLQFSTAKKFTTPDEAIAYLETLKGEAEE